MPEEFVEENFISDADFDETPEEYEEEEENIETPPQKINPDLQGWFL